MSIKSFRNIVAGLIVFSLLGIAVFAFGERVLPETLFKLFTAEASAAAADPQSDTAPETTNPEDSAPKIPVRKLMGRLTTASFSEMETYRSVSRAVEIRYTHSAKSANR